MDRPGLASRPAIKGEERQNDGGGLRPVRRRSQGFRYGTRARGRPGGKVALPYRRFGFTLTGPLTGAHRKLGRRLAWRPSSIIDVSLVRYGQARRLSGGRSFARARTCKGGTRHDAFGYIARILGPVLVIIGLGLLLEGETFRAMAGEFLRSAALIYFSGVATLAVGLAILNVHHLWTRDWRSIITVFGWLASSAASSGSWRPIRCRGSQSFIAHQRWPIMGAIVTLALGGFLSVMGYQDIWVAKRRVHHRTSAVKSSGAASRSAKRPRRKSGETRS